MSEPFLDEMIYVFDVPAEVAIEKALMNLTRASYQNKYRKWIEDYIVAF